MAESSCSVKSNNVNVQDQVSVVQRINSIEDNNDKTDKGKQKHNLQMSTIKTSTDGSFQPLFYSK